MKIIRVARKSGWKTGRGLIKIELENPEQLKLVLKSKKKLKDTPVKEIRKVFLRQSKKEEMLVAERNEDLILRELGV